MNRTEMCNLIFSFLHNNRYMQVYVSIFQVLAPDVRCSYVPDVRCSYAPDVRCSYAPDLRCSYAPDERCSYAPDVRCSYAPDVRCSYAPDVRCSYAPYVRCGYVPDVICSYVPDVRCSHAPDVRCSYAPDVRCSSAHDVRCSYAPDVRCSYAPDVKCSNVPDVSFYWVIDVRFCLCTRCRVQFLMCNMQILLSICFSTYAQFQKLITPEDDGFFYFLTYNFTVSTSYYFLPVFLFNLKQQFQSSSFLGQGELPELLELPHCSLTLNSNFSRTPACIPEISTQRTSFRWHGNRKSAEIFPKMIE